MGGSDHFASDKCTGCNQQGVAAGQEAALARPTMTTRRTSPGPHFHDLLRERVERPVHADPQPVFAFLVFVVAVIRDNRRAL